MNLILKYLLIVFGCLPLCMHAQPANFYWKNFDLRHGLSSPFGSCSFQDKNGHIWIGTRDGLNRFDGNRFELFDYNPHGGKNLIDDQIWAIAQALNGDIICGTSEGLSVIRYLDGDIINTQIQIEGIDHEYTRLVRDVEIWPDGKIWLATVAGIVLWEDQKFSLLKGDIKFPINSDQIFQSNRDTSKCWVASLDGVWEYDNSTGKLERIKSKYERFDLYSERSVDGMCLDNQERIWYSTMADTSIFCYDPKDGYEFQIKQLFKNKAGEKISFYTNFLFCDINDQIWLCPWTYPIRIIDPHTGQYQLLADAPEFSMAIPDNRISHINQCKNGDLWICHSKGISVHSPLLELLRTHKMSNTQQLLPEYEPYLTCVEEIDKTRILVGTRLQGMYLIDRKSAISEQFVIRDSEENVLEINSIEFYDSTVWCATPAGIYKGGLDGHFRKFDFLSNNPINKTNINDILIDQQNQLWIAPEYGYLTKINLSDHSVQTIQDTSANSQKANYSQALLLDNDERLWVGGINGIRFLNIKENTWNKVNLRVGERGFVRTNNVNTLALSKSGHVWFSTSGGIGKINADLKSYEAYTELNGLRNEYCFILGFDPQNNVWLGSPNGLFYFNENDKQFNLLHSEQYISPNAFYMNGQSLSDGNLIFTSLSTILELNSETLKNFYTISAPLVSFASSDSSSFLIQNNTLQLNKNQNYFSLYFSSISDAYRDDIEYEYQLVGHDETWIKAANRNFASYNNVAGGNYTFLLRARINGGDWISSDSDFLITIEKKIHETFLFRIIILTAVLVIIYTITKIYIRRKRNIIRQELLNDIIHTSQELNEDELCRFSAQLIRSQLKLRDCAIYTSNPLIPSELKLKAGFGKHSQILEDTINMNLESTNFADIQNSHQLNYYNKIRLDVESVLLGVILCQKSNNKQLSDLDKEILNDIAKVLSDKIVQARRSAEIQEKEQILSQINSLLSESQLVSLRAQMNPHFVFNCLNSIQESIVMKHYAEAGMYLNKFSKLFRKVLQNSSRNLIPLSEEIEVLQLYLQLEHMRFQESFEFEIEYDDELDAEEINIPSMLLQPFVENALWHGLMHKDGSRKLSIRFFPKNEDIFICEIEDNGVGRTKSAEIKNMKSSTLKHESKGIAISIDRLNLINKKQEKHASVEIIDLYDNQGIALGTKVKFELSSFL